jgi:hypothetical protein
MLRKTIAMLLVIGLVLLPTISCTFKTTLPELEPPTNSTPHGIYTAIVLGYRETITFSGDTLTTFHELDGKQVYTYRIENQVIRLTNVTTGVTSTRTFMYSSEDDSVTLGSTIIPDVSISITYLKD